MEYGVTLKRAEELLANRERFASRTLSATWEALIGGHSVYVVRSYGVEIASYEESGRRFINSRAYDYSVTTSKHANIVKRAWGLN